MRGRVAREIEVSIQDQPTLRVFTYDEHLAVTADEKLETEIRNEADVNNISNLLFGEKSFFGKAAYLSALVNIVGNDDQDDEKKKKEKEDDLREQLEEIQERLTAWDNTKIMVGGTEMTNAEALTAVHKINQSPDLYIDKAIREGRLKEEDRERVKADLKKTEELMREQREIKAKDKNLDLSSEKLRELQNLQTRSDAGKVMAEAFINDKKNENLSWNSKEQKDQSNSELRSHNSVAPSIDEDVFQSKGELSLNFSKATQATEPLDVTKPPTVLATSQVSKDLKATGLDF